MIQELLNKITESNLELLVECELEDQYTLEKMIDWQNDYDEYATWEEFKENWYKCSRCLSYERYDACGCICYAR